MILNKERNNHHNNHVPVLLEQVLSILSPNQGESYLDLTAGYGGHAREVISRTNAPQKAYLVDRDSSALESLGDLEKKGAHLVHADSASASSELVGQHKKFDNILLDLGVSSPHLDNPSRGFSFQKNGPLDMRMDQTKGETAKDLIERLPESELAQILKTYGEEPHYKRIAKTIKNSPVPQTTKELADIIEDTHSGLRGKIHPATRTFQALRIAVNEELEQLDKILSNVEELLSSNGRLAIISFHSLEDRKVKNFIKERTEVGYESTMVKINNKPILGKTESFNNPRARSAVLRGVQLK